MRSFVRGFRLISAVALSLGIATTATEATRAQAASTGPISATVYACPAGMTRETFAPDECNTVLTEGFGIVVASVQADVPVQTLQGADFDGVTFTWPVLPVPKDYNVNPALPPDSPYAFPTVVDVAGEDGNPISLTEESPSASVAVYVFLRETPGVDEGSERSPSDDDTNGGTGNGGVTLPSTGVGVVDDDGTPALWPLFAGGLLAILGGRAFARRRPSA